MPNYEPKSQQKITKTSISPTNFSTLLEKIQSTPKALLSSQKIKQYEKLPTPRILQ